MEEKSTGTNPKAMLGPILEIATTVIRDPASFFRQMPKFGGYTDPLIFAVVMGAVAGIVNAVLSPLGPYHFSLSMAIGTIIVTPIVTGILSFVFGGILFLIWQLMGSKHPYEVSYRCVAYALAITPITSILNFIPYLGILVSLAWTAFIYVHASVEVHGIKPKTAWMVFGVLFALLAICSVSMQHTARSVQHKVESLGKSLGDIDKMKPEQAGQAVGEFLKGMEKGINK